MSAHLRMALWNVLHTFLFEDGVDSKWWRDVLVMIYVRLHMRLDQLSYAPVNERVVLSNWWFSERRQWFELYDLVDFVVPALSRYRRDADDVPAVFNRALESEGSPYRFIGGALTEITDPAEVGAIEEAQRAGDDFAGARTHINRALELLGQRPNPDYRNSISESISAVESTLKALTGLEHADLARALREFSNLYPIHAALFRGLDSLYGYTSNEHGIRHALLEGNADVGFAEAKFMVVACAAFMNFLITKEAG
jgi:hypothetical protein